jgi:ribosomal protein L16/L10AE
MFEIVGLDEKRAKEVLTAAAKKLPVKTTVIAK